MKKTYPLNSVALVSLLLLLIPPDALACSYKPRSFEVNYTSAPTVFIGHVASVTKDKVIFTVDKSIKGKTHRKKHTISRGHSSCHVDFRPGTYWLFMGEYVYQGTILLYDELGRPIAASAKLIKDKLNIDISGSEPSVFKAIAVNACGPTDNAVFYIRLKSGLTAMVEGTIDAYEGRSGPVEFKALPGKSGGAAIYACDSDGRNCGPRLNGSLLLTEVGPAMVKGYMEVIDTVTGSKQRSIFEAERLEDQTVCP
jgi:hypothetical protein